MNDSTLYQRLGGRDGIETLVDDIVAAHLRNPVISPRFEPYVEDPERLGEVKAHLCDFLAQGSGGPASYEGRSMPAAHRGMNISVEEYMAAVDDIMAALDENDIGERAKKDVLAISYRLKDEIVHY